MIQDLMIKRDVNPAQAAKRYKLQTRFEFALHHVITFPCFRLSHKNKRIMKALPLFLTLLLTTAMAFVPRSTYTASRLQNHPFSPGPLFGVFERLSGKAAEVRRALEFIAALASASEDGNITKEELITLNSTLGKFIDIQRGTGEVVAQVSSLITLNSPLGKSMDIQKGTGEVVAQASPNPIIPIIQKVLTDSIDAEFKSEREGLEYDTYPEHPEVSPRSISWSELHIYSTHSFAVSGHHFGIHDEDGQGCSALALFLLSKQDFSSFHA